MNKNIKYDNITPKQYNDFTDNEKKNWRIYISSKSLENFVKIYLPHHFSYTLKKVKGINNSLEEEKNIKVNKLRKKAKREKIDNEEEIKELIKLYHDAKVNENISDKVLFNNTTLETFGIYEKVLNNTSVRYALAKARGFAKTTELLALLLFAASYKRLNFVIYVGETLDKATEALLDFADEIENNTYLKYDFPHLKPKRSDLTNKQVAFNQKNLILQSDMKIMAASAVRTSLRGKKRGVNRPDCIIIDDIEKDEHIESPIQRKKLYRWLQRQVMSLGGAAGISIIITGTIIHYDSLMANLTIKENFSNFETAIFSALNKESGKPNWIEVWNEARLEIEKQNLGVNAFSSEYLCNPLPDEEQIFTENMINANLFDYDEVKEVKNKIGYLDMAVTGAGDYTAFIIGCKKENNLYVLDGMIEKININFVMPHIANYIDKWEISTVGVESNGQEFFIAELKKYLNKERKERKWKKTVNVIGVHHSDKKENRIANLISPKLVANQLLFIKNYIDVYPLLIEQLLGFPVWGYDDAPDALAGFIEIVDKYVIEFFRLDFE